MMSEFEMYRQQLRNAIDEMELDNKEAVYDLLSEVNRFYEVSSQSRWTMERRKSLRATVHSIIPHLDQQKVA